MKIKFVFALTTALVIATPAMAQDEPRAFNGGARVEARFGLDDVVLSANGDSGSKAGVSYGAEIGYDYATASGVVIGAYAGIDGSSVKKCGEVLGNDEACIKAGRNISAGVRAGGVVRSGLLYLKGGYSNGRATATYVDSSSTRYSTSGNLDGWHIGAGYEVAVSGNTYAKIEYVFTKYDTSNDLGVDVGVQRHQALVGLGYRF